MRPIFDGVVRLRAPTADDVATIASQRDAEAVRWLGAGSEDPSPTACVEVAGELVGWVDADRDPDHDWLAPDEVNVGYCLFATDRGKGYASRAVQLLMHHLALEGVHRTATLLVDPRNAPSLGVAERTGFAARGTIRDQLQLARRIPPLTYTDGVITIRRQDPAMDLEAHLGAIDDEQIDWLWLPGHREAWEALDPDGQVAHQRRHLGSSRDDFGSGPNWRFSADTADLRYVSYVDCDLANDAVRAGEANISYVTHPAQRSRGYAARSVRLVCRFLHDHTGARSAYLCIDERNAASLRVAASTGAVECGRRHLDDGSMRVVWRIGLRS